MTSVRQLEANRRNASRSTGPTTAEGKLRSRRNAVRHGLCAETVVDIIEDLDDYRGFEAAIIADYDARTAVERELVLRLASLLWRLRRTTAIETDLLRIQAEILRDRRVGRGRMDPLTNAPRSVLEFASCNLDDIKRASDGVYPRGKNDIPDSTDAPQQINSTRQLTLCFQRLANLDNVGFERLGRYEQAIARQVLKTVYLLRSLRSNHPCYREKHIGRASTQHLPKFDE